MKIKKPKISPVRKMERLSLFLLLTLLTSCFPEQVKLSLDKEGEYLEIYPTFTRLYLFKYKGGEFYQLSTVTPDTHFEDKNKIDLKGSPKDVNIEEGKFKITHSSKYRITVHYLDTSAELEFETDSLNQIK